MTLPLPPSADPPRPADDDDPFFAPAAPAAVGARMAIRILASGALLISACITGRLTLPFLGTIGDGPPVAPMPTLRIEDLQAPPLPLPQMKYPVLAVGQCLSTIGGATLDTTNSVLPCSERHVGEVFEVMPVDGDTYPGEDALATKSEDCTSRVAGYADPKKIKKMKIYSVQPTAVSWLVGDRTVYCVVGDEATATTGSVRKKSA
jgi:Septum formation